MKKVSYTFFEGVQFEKGARIKRISAQSFESSEDLKKYPHPSLVKSFEVKIDYHVRRIKSKDAFVVKVGDLLFTSNNPNILKWKRKGSDLRKENYSIQEYTIKPECNSPDLWLWTIMGIYLNDYFNLIPIE